MGYKLVCHEWDIPENERDAAQFILAMAGVEFAQWATGETEMGRCQKAALTKFRDDFYLRIASALRLESSYQDMGFGHGVLSISANGTKVSGWRVERVPEP